MACAPMLLVKIYIKMSLGTEQKLK